MRSDQSTDLYLSLTRLLGSENTAPLISIVGGGGKTHTAFYLAQLFKAQGKRVCVTTTTKMFLPVEEEVDQIVDIASLMQDAELKPDKTVPQKIPSVTFLYKKVVNSKPGAQTKLSGSSADELDWVRQRADFDVYIVEADGARNKPLKAPAGHEPCIPDCTSLTIAVTGAEALLTPAAPENIHRWTLFAELTGCQPNQKIDSEIMATLLSSPNGLFQYTPQKARRLWVINKMDRAESKSAIEELAAELLQRVPALDAVWLAELQRNNPVCVVLQE